MNDQTRLEIIQKIARKAIEMTQGKTRESLESDHMFCLAVTELLTMMGNAIADISTTKQAELPQIKWMKFLELRNHIVHTYYDVNLDDVWDTLTKDLKPLIDELERVLL